MFEARKKQLGARIRNRREEIPYTQEQLAKMAGITRQTLYRIEKGRHACSIDVLFLLAEALRVELVELLREEE